MTLFLNNRPLLEAFRKGDENALHEIYCHYVRKIELFVANGWYNTNSKTRTYGVASFEVQAELVQEVFIQAFSKKARLAYDGIRPYKIFLLGIARNTVADYIRTKHRDALSHVGLELDGAEINDDQFRFLEELDENGRSVENDFDWQRGVQATEQYVETLDDLLKNFVCLRFKKDLPLVEVARTLDITRGKARFLEQDFVRRLKRHFRNRKIRVTFT